MELVAGAEASVSSAETESEEKGSGVEEDQGAYPVTGAGAMSPKTKTPHRTAHGARRRMLRQMGAQMPTK